MKFIVNSIHPEQYDSLGNGSVWTYIRSVGVGKNSVKIAIEAPHAIKEHVQIKIQDPEVIGILPILLNGEISCYDAMQSLESFLRRKHGLAMPNSSSSYLAKSEQDPLKIRLNRLFETLVSKKDAFADLCLFFPREHSERFKSVFDIPLKVVSDEIIDAIKENFVDFLQSQRFSQHSKAEKGKERETKDEELKDKVITSVSHYTTPDKYNPRHFAPILTPIKAQIKQLIEVSDVFMADNGDVHFTYGDYKLATELSELLHKIGIGDLQEKARPKKLTVLGIEGSLNDEKYQLELTCEEYDTLMDNKTFYAGFSRG